MLSGVHVWVCVCDTMKLVEGVIAKEVWPPTMSVLKTCRCGEEWEYEEI